MLFACEQVEKEILPATDLSGMVTIVNDSVDDFSDVMVSVEGANGSFSTQTDSLGQYIIKDLPGGTYNFVYTKEEYVVQKVISYSFTGEEEAVIPNVRIYPKVHVTLDNLEIRAVASSRSFTHEVLLQFTHNISPYAQSMRYYVGTSPEVSFRNHTYTNRFTLSFGRIYQLFLNLPLLKNEPNVYVIFYPEFFRSRYSDDFYIDIETGSMVFPFVNTDVPSEVFEVVLNDSEQ